VSYSAHITVKLPNQQLVKQNENDYIGCAMITPQTLMFAFLFVRTGFIHVHVTMHMSSFSQLNFHIYESIRIFQFRLFQNQLWYTTFRAYLNKFHMQ